MGRQIPNIADKRCKCNKHIVSNRLNKIYRFVGFFAFDEKYLTYLYAVHEMMYRNNRAKARNIGMNL